jgi:hypothetical protein
MKPVKKAMKQNSIIFLLCCIFIAGCVSVTAEAVYPPATLNTAAITISPVKSLIPSKTLTPSPTLGLTSQAATTMIAGTRIVQTAQSSETQEKIAAVNSEFLEICESRNPSLSPDENWLAQDCFSNQFMVSSRESSRTIVISYQEIMELTGDAMRISNVQPLFWTADGRYLFFTQHVCCIDTDAFGWDGALLRLNLNTGEAQVLISGHMNYFSFSPNGNTLIHIPNDHAGGGMPLIINIMDTKAWSQTRLLFSDYEQAGSLVWAPDESGFTLTTKIGNYYAGGEEFSVIVVDFSSGSSKIIFTQNSTFVGPVDWSEDNIVTLVESCNQLQVDDFNDCANQFMFYDLNAETFR